VFEVREATADDADAIASAHIEGWRVGYRGIVADAALDAETFNTTRRERWRAWTWKTSSEVELFVVTIDSQVVGFGLVGAERAEPGKASGSTGSRGEVYAFYLHPTAWGSGAAGPLMRRCERHLRDTGFKEAVLWVLRDNPRARRFYEKAGWSVTGEESDFTPSGSPADPLPEVQYAAAL
jgi:ribosomal protein S18 acetylase RimI-like enzyme